MRQINLRALSLFLLFTAIIVGVRLAQILTTPFFPDEADYIYFAQLALTQKGMGFASLTEGVRPLHTWLMIPFLMVFNPPLLAARFLSLVTGVVTMWGLYLLTIELFKKKQIGILSVITFILFPYAQLYNSLAVLESTVGMFVVSSVFLGLRLVKNPKFSTAYTFGIVTGLGLLTKRQAFFNIYLLPFFFLLLPRGKKVFITVVKVAAVFSFAIGIAYVMQLVLLNSVWFERIAWFEGGNIHTKRAWLELPFSIKYSFFKANLATVATFTFQYLAFPYIFLILYSFTQLRKFAKEILIPSAFFVIPTLAIIIFGRWVAERWLYPAFIFLPLLIAFGLYYFSENFQKAFAKKYKNSFSVTKIVYAVFFSFPIFYIILMIVNPIKSPLPYHEKYSYFMCPVSYFEKDIQHLTVVSKNQQIFLGTQNHLGLKNVMVILLRNYKNIKIDGFQTTPDRLPVEVERMSEIMPTYYATFLEAGPTPKTKKTLQLLSNAKSPYATCNYKLFKVIDQDN